MLCALGIALACFIASLAACIYCAYITDKRAAAGRKEDE